MEHNVFSKNPRNNKCTVCQSKVNEVTDFLVFKTKQLLFTVNTRVKETKLLFSALRQERSEERRVGTECQY